MRGATAFRLACILAVVAAIAACPVWKWRHDAIFSNRLTLLVYRLSASVHDRRLLLLGDSNVAYMDCSPQLTGWHILNLGVSGIQTDQLLRYLNGLRPNLPQFDAAVLWVGVNDALWGGIVAEDSARNVLAALDALSAVAKRRALVSQPLLPAGSEVRSASANPEIAAMNMMLAQQTKADLATVITPFSSEPLATQRDLFRDGLHLTASGYGRVCAEIARWLAEHE